METYLILFRGPDGRSLRPDPEAFAQHIERLNAWISSLPEPNRVVGGEPLDLRYVKSITQRGTLVTDGPFVESKEMVGGYLRIAAESEGSLVQWAQKCPIFEFEGGAIELRQVEKNGKNDVP